jgi:AcrR family transcriptional regulator
MNELEARPPNSGDASRQRLLDAAIGLFAEHGFVGSSVRDLARETGMSLSGLYHHFSSKDEMLYEIQKRSFEQLLDPVSHLDPQMSPVDKLQVFIRNHVTFFSRQQTKMKLLSHELGALSGDFGVEISHLRGRYYRICLETVTDLMRELESTEVDPGVATMALFGMINWIYRWYPRPGDPGPEELAKQMLSLFLRGVTGGRSSQAAGANCGSQ